jgi:hypothetical protein
MTTRFQIFSSHWYPRVTLGTVSGNSVPAHDSMRMFDRHEKSDEQGLQTEHQWLAVSAWLDSALRLD